MRSAALRLVENDPPTILSVATAVPRFRLDQTDVARAAARVFDRERSDIDRLMPVFDNAGIATRHSSVPMDWYFETHGWRERNRAEAADAARRLAAGDDLDHDFGRIFDARQRHTRKRP